MEDLSIYEYPKFDPSIGLIIDGKIVVMQKNDSCDGCIGKNVFDICFNLPNGCAEDDYVWVYLNKE